ncbi:MAG: DUF3592 domain-containing protein [Calditrichae bacterium]|nr:DUF3592 domain-containing protein [Calditrichia bacterium]
MANVIWILCGGFFVLAFFIGGVVALYFGIRNRQKGTESQNWPQVTGTITKAGVKKDHDTDAEGFTTTTYIPEVEYEYQLGEDVYSNGQISFGGTKTYNSRKKAEEAISQYPLDGRISVFYNPEKPDESVLIQGTKGTMALIIAGVVFIAISICAPCIGLIIYFTSVQ